MKQAILCNRLTLTLLILGLLPACNNHRTEEIVFTPVYSLTNSPNRSDLDSNLQSSLLKKTKDMTREEAEYAYSHYQAQADLGHAAKALERLIALSTDHALTAQLTLELADTYLGLKDYAKAQKLYQEYRLIQPGSDNAMHAAYNEILACQGDILDTPWDQAKTSETLKAARNFIEDFGTQTVYSASVKELIQKCYKKMSAKDIRLAQYYLTKYGYTEQPNTLKAAHERLNHVIIDILPNIEQFDNFSIDELREQLSILLANLPVQAESKESKDGVAKYTVAERDILQKATTLLSTAFDCPYSYYW